MDPIHDLAISQTKLSQLSGLVVGLGNYCLCKCLFSGVMEMEKEFFPTKYGLQSRFKLAENTPAPYETIRSWLLIERPLAEPYIEVPGANGHACLIKISSISYIEDEKQ